MQVLQHELGNFKAISADVLIKRLSTEVLDTSIAPMPSVSTRTRSP